MSHNNNSTNSFFEQYFEDRFTPIASRLSIWAVRRYPREDELTRDQALQNCWVAMWKYYSQAPEVWAPRSPQDWMNYARGIYRKEIARYHRNGSKLGKVVSDMAYYLAKEPDIAQEEALSLAQHASRSAPNQFVYPREIQLAELRIDLEKAIERGLKRLCKSQQRDMPKLISDILEGYKLEETCERHGWTRNRGVTLMRKLRTVFYEEMTGEKKTGYLGSHHPLTDAEKQRIKELYATGLSYRKVAARVGRSASAVEGVCKKYPPEMVEQVHQLYAEGLSYKAIGARIGRAKSYVGWLIMAEGIDKRTLNREGEDMAPIPVAV